jgi:uroporphyrinogen decarboxylase
MASEGWTHRQRIEHCLSGDLPDRPPVALWRHFPVDDQSPGALAKATIDFQRSFDFDLVKVTPASSFAVKDWGVEDQWNGSTEGTRDYTRRAIQHPEDWTRLTAIDPDQGYLAEQLQCLQMIVTELGPETPVLQTIFNPLSQAKNLVGGDKLLVHLRRYPDAVHAGLRTIAASTQRFVEAAFQTGIAGVFFAVQHAQYGLLSLAEYDTFGRAYDLEILEPARDAWLNLLHLHGEEIMFDQLADYPVAVLNWHDQDTPPSLSQARERYSGVVCGGLQRWNTMVLGTPEQVSAEARQAIQATGGQRFILGTGCVLPIVAPRANILAARLSVEIDL